MGWLSERDRQPELMDQPGLEPKLHHQALKGLQRVNAISGCVRSIWKPIEAFCLQNDGRSRPFRVLDVASGGGDVAIGLAESARRSGLDVQVDGCDISETAIAYAQEKADFRGASVSFFYADALNDGLPDGYDVICCSLFLHHLDEADVIQLLKTMRQQTQEMIVISDLLRSRLGYALCWAGIRLLTRSRICHVDGPLSVRAAFTVNELKELATAAGMESMKLSRLWPQRVLMQWDKTLD